MWATPIAVDNPTDPTIIEFPFSFTRPPGTHRPTEPTPSRSRARRTRRSNAEDGKDLVASGNDHVHTRRYHSAVDHGRRAVSGRTVQITFSTALDPSTVTLQNIFVIRQGSADDLAADGRKLLELHQPEQ